jgi:hypothetical protein
VASQLINLRLGFRAVASAINDCSPAERSRWGAEEDALLGKTVMLLENYRKMQSKLAQYRCLQTLFGVDARGVSARKMDVAKSLQCLVLDESDVVFSTLSSSALGRTRFLAGSLLFI